MKVVVAPDSFGGTLTASEAAAAIADGWRRSRPGDEVVLRPLSDGGEGLLDVVARPDDTWIRTEVAGPQGHPVDAALLWRTDRTAIIESALACGLHLLEPAQRTPSLATSYGVGQLLDAARELGARRILVGLGGTASVDGGVGALTGLAYRPMVADGSGLKIGADDLPDVTAITRGWSADWDGVEVVLLADVDATLDEAAPRFGPQKGARPDEIDTLTAALRTWAEVATRDLPGEVDPAAPGTGAAGGLGFGLAAALPGARLVAGAGEIARLVDLTSALTAADLVVTGEGRLDATSEAGKVPVFLRRTAGCPVAAVVGSVTDDDARAGFLDVEAATDGAPGPQPAREVSAAAARLAARADG